MKKNFYSLAGVKKYLALAALGFFCVSAHAQIITTVVGNGGSYVINGTALYFGGDGGPATSAYLNTAFSFAFDTAGNMIIAENGTALVRKVNKAGIISTIAGTLPIGTSTQSGLAGDGGPATAAKLAGPTAVATDTFGNIFIADVFNYRVRNINATGVINTYAGTSSGFAGDGGLATAAKITPQNITVDRAGNLYIADNSNLRVRKVDRITGNISTIAGGGTSDGTAATSAYLNTPYNMAFDAAGNMYIVEAAAAGRVRKIDAVTGKISTLAGTGTSGFSGDGGPATAAQINGAYGIALDATGNIYIADRGNNRIRKIDKTTGNISTVVGTGTASYTGDNGLATAATIKSPNSVVFDAAGDMYIADGGNNSIRKVTMSTGVITTVAGTGSSTGAYSGDGGLATIAQLNFPVYVRFDAAGNMYIADNANGRIRKVAVGTGIITTIAGIGTNGYSGDGGLATAAQLSGPADVFFDAANNIYITDRNNRVIRKIDAISGNISTFSGINSAASATTGDGGLASTATYMGPWSMGKDAAGNLYVVDNLGYRIRKITTSTGVISTVVGGGAGDGGLATNAILETVRAVAIDTFGTIFISEGNRVRKINPATGIISTVAGKYGSTGASISGSGSLDSLSFPWGLAPDNIGGVFIADVYNQRVLKVPASGSVQKIAGVSGIGGFLGDGGPATSAYLNNPYCLNYYKGKLYISDGLNRRIRMVDFTCSNLTAGTLASSAGDNFCGTGATTLSLPNAAPAGNVNYQWMSSPDSLAWTNLVTTTTAPVTPTSTTYYKVVLACATGTAKDSTAGFKVTVNPNVSATVNITVAPNDTVCAGTPVTYTAAIANGGTSPSYSWTVNGDFAGRNSNTYTLANPLNGDSVVCILTSNAACVAATTVTSNNIKMIVNPIVTPIVTVTANPGTVITTGTSVTFSANVTDGGTNPSYTWKKNGVIVGANTSTYTDNALVNGDTIICTVQGSDVCADSAASAAIGIEIETTGIKNISGRSKELLFYPNPTTGIVNMNIQAATITISGLDGRTIMEKQNVQSIVIAQLANGVYVIKAIDAKGNAYVGKIVKQ